MDVDVSNLDLLYLALAVVVYATGATLWTYFARPRRDGAGKRPAVSARIGAVPPAVVEFFDEADAPEQHWREAPSAR